MATNIKLVLDKRYVRKDKTFPLIMRLLRSRKSISIPLGIYLREDEWNVQKEQVRKNSRVASDATRLNNLIQKRRTQAFDIINELTDSGRIGSMDLKTIKKYITDKKAVPSLFNYTQTITDELKNSGRFGTAQNYSTLLSNLKKFRNGKDMELKQLDYTFLKKFENYYHAKGFSVNGLAALYKNLRAVCNRAIREKLMPRDWYPFEEYQIKKVQTKKRAVSKDVIKAIERLEFEAGSSLWLTQKMFLFSFYVAGINLSDMADLRYSDIIGGRVEYSRNKTGKPHSIKLSEKAFAIVRLFKKDDCLTSYIFPIKEEGCSAARNHRNAHTFNSMLNRQLKEIGKLVDSEISLTMYVARHTYATQAKRLGISTEIISELLNHRDLKTTQVYLAGLESSVLDQANDLITG